MSRDKQQREDLANFIKMITREETPFMSSIGKEKAQSIYQEWQTDQIAPHKDYRKHLGTYTQVDGKKIAISGTPKKRRR